jgi:hypothetical protein
MSGDAGAPALAQNEPRDLIRASIRARAVAASTVWRVPACNSSIAARRSSRRPGVASRSASASAETQSSSGIEYTTGLSVALRLSRRTTQIARPGRIGARLRDDAGRLVRWSTSTVLPTPGSPRTDAAPADLDPFGRARLSYQQYFRPPRTLAYRVITRCITRSPVESVGSGLRVGPKIGCAGGIAWLAVRFAGAGLSAVGSAARRGGRHGLRAGCLAGCAGRWLPVLLVAGVFSCGSPGRAGARRR